MEPKGESRGGGGEENKQPQPQPQPQGQPPSPPPPPPHQVVQSSMCYPSTVVPSTIGGADDRVNKLSIGGESRVQQGPTSETQQLLDMYVLDCMIKSGMHNAAEIFRQEAGVHNDPIKIDDPDGVLKQWWSASYDVYVSSKMKNAETK